ncbi:MAG: radical SAM protein [Candidatus Symbiothrix sp.]|jgi:radical SAM protein with 4Fe4S-binding SPASM domain|nr:radical SAM protein [Candidatus Symbiothrix sp.]
MKTLLANQDIFIIPSSKEDRYIVYFPLRGLIFLANSKAAEIIHNHITTGETIPTEYPKLHAHFQKLNAMEIVLPQERKIEVADKVVFILSQKCNLACSYCYAQESRSQDTLDKNKIKTIVDYVLSVFNDKIKSFSFIGGGEPTVTWDLFTWSVNYIRNAAGQQKIDIGLTTNATLLSEARIMWLKQNEVRIGISFDILPAIQDRQRGFSNSSKSSFDTVDRVIKLLTSNGFYPRIRSTITRQNVALMPDMVQFVIEYYPELKRLHFEHVTDVEQNQTDFYDDFVSYFFKAKELGEANGIEVHNSIDNATNHIKSRFCGGEFCITPTGDLVSCHRVSSKTEKLFENFCYGLVNNKVQINKKHLAEAESIANSKLSQCSTCFAKWHCAGGCTNNRLLFSPEQLSVHCEFTKKMIIKGLENKLEK